MPKAAQSDGVPFEANAGEPSRSLASVSRSGLCRVIAWPGSQFAVDQLRGEGHDGAAPSAKRVRRDPKAIARYRAMQAARQRQLRSRQRFVAISVAASIALVCVVGIGVQSGRAKIQGTLTARNASVKNGVTVG